MQINSWCTTPTLEQKPVQKCFQQLVDWRDCVLSYVEHFTYWDNKFSSHSEVWRLAERRKEQHYNDGDRWTRHKDKQDERVIFRAFLSIFYFEFVRRGVPFSARTVFILRRHFLPVIRVRNKITRSRSLHTYKYNYFLALPLLFLVILSVEGNGYM